MKKTIKQTVSDLEDAVLDLGDSDAEISDIMESLLSYYYSKNTLTDKQMRFASVLLEGGRPNHKSSGNKKKKQTNLPVMFLVRKKGKKKAHLWDGMDTYCRLWSTGGITAKKAYTIDDNPRSRPICTMCQTVSGRIYGN